MVELLKQPQFEPVPVEEQIVLIWAGTSGLLKDIPVTKLIEFEKEYRSYMTNYAGNVLKAIKKEKKLSDGILKDLKKHTKGFIEQWQPSEQLKNE